MIARRELAGMALATTLGIKAAFAQQGMRRVAILSPGASETRGTFTAFRTRLRELGQIEGRDIAIAFHLANGAERLPQLARRIHDEGADVAVADGQLASAALHAMGCRIPIVAVAGFDPVARGYAASVARPGGCMTGVATITDLIAPKALEMLREILPAARRIGVVYAAINRPTHIALEERAAALGLQLRHVVVASPGDAATALSPTALADLDGLVLPPNPIVAGLSATVAPLIAAARKPAIYGDRDFVNAGGLAFYSYDITDAYRLLARYVDRILRGASAGDLPFEQPTRIELVLNLATARAIGLQLPAAILARADEVIE